MQRFLEVTDPYSVEPVILVEDPTRPPSHNLAASRTFKVVFSRFSPHCDGRCVVVPAETTRLHGRTVCSVLVHVPGTQMLVERKILFLGRARLQGCTSGFVCNCRQNEDDTKANESTDVGTDEDLDGGSNNGASLRGRSQ